MKIELIAQWLYRRYRPCSKPEWTLLGGIEKARWLNDAQGVFDKMMGRLE